MKKVLFALSFAFILMLSIQSCKEDEDIVTDIDKSLFSESTASGFANFKNGDLLAGVSPSPHGSFKLRFNSIAAAALDSSGKLPMGASFPDGSLIVKDIFSGSDISLYAVMKKDPNNENAASGWVWAEYKPDGSIAYNLNKKGAACVGCHGGTPNRDFTRTFDLH